VNESMAVGVLMRVVVVCERTSPTTQPVSVRTGVGMAVLKAAVSVQGSLVHRPHDTNAEQYERAILAKQR
jgi:hypothetical protein